jgi:hypothetical protein
MTSFLAQDEQLEMLPARTQLTTFSFGGNGGNGGNGGGNAYAQGGNSSAGHGLINVNALNGNALAIGGNGNDGGHGGNGGSSYVHNSWGGGHKWGCK